MATWRSEPGVSWAEAISLVYNRCLCVASLGLVRAAELIRFYFSSGLFWRLKEKTFSFISSHRNGNDSSLALLLSFFKFVSLFIWTTSCYIIPACAKSPIPCVFPEVASSWTPFRGLPTSNLNETAFLFSSLAFQMHICKRFHHFPDYVAENLFPPIEYVRLKIWGRNKHQVFFVFLLGFYFPMHEGLNLLRVFPALPSLTQGGK